MTLTTRNCKKKKKKKRKKEKETLIFLPINPSLHNFFVFFLNVSKLSANRTDTVKGAASSNPD